MYQEEFLLSTQNDPDWITYRKWNETLCAFFFNEDQAHKPTRLDMNEDVLESIANKIEIPIAEVEDQFKKLNRKFIQKTYFDDFTTLAKSWKYEDGDSCPVIVPLCFISLVAEHMVRDDQFASHNYYGRLKAFCNIDNSNDDVTKSFQSFCKIAWPKLNEWLDFWDHELGKPTAKALDNRKYVSVAISQALIRDQDRYFLKQIFISNELFPGDRIKKDQMKHVILYSSDSRFTNLKKLFELSPEPFIDACIDELNAWDGTFNAHKKDHDKTYKLFYFAHINFYQKRLILGLSSFLDEGLSNLEYKINKDASEDNLSETLNQDLYFSHLPELNLNILEPKESLPNGDILHSHLSIKSHDDEIEISRSGQLVVILNYLPEKNIYKEVRNVSLGLDCLILFHTSVEEKVKNALKDISSPDYEIFSGTNFQGLPDKWFIATKVKVFNQCTIPGLEALSPKEDQAIHFNGGLHVGNNNYYFKQPPEISFIAASNEKLDLNILDIEKKEVVFSKSFEQGAGIIDTKVLKLPKAIYKVELKKGNSVLAHDILKLVCAEGSQKIKTASTICHYLGNDTFSIIGATKKSINSDGLRGYYLDYQKSHPEHIKLLEIKNTKPSLNFESLDDFIEKTQNTSTQEIDKITCESSAHHWIIESLPIKVKDRNLKLKQYCQNCQKIKWEFASAAKRNKKKIEFDSEIKQNTRENIQFSNNSIEKSNDEFEYDEIFDALCFIKRGSYEKFSQITRFYDDTSLFPYKFIKQLSSSGYLDIEFNEKTLKPKAWHISNPTLTKISSGAFILSGWRSDDFIDQIKNYLAKNNGELIIKKNEDFISEFYIKNISNEEAAVLVDILDEETIFKFNLSLNFCNNFLSLMPKLHNLKKVLLKHDLHNLKKDYFSMNEMKWIEVDEAHMQTGAYRSKDYGNRYFYVDDETIKDKQGFLCDAKLAKYFALSNVHSNWFCYDEQKKQIILPEHMEPPFLYERLLIANSGSRPYTENGNLIYTGIDKDIAEGINFKLFGE